MGAFINIVLHGVVYFASRRSAEDNNMLQLYASKLVGVARDLTFNALYSQIARDWRQRDDIFKSFHDRRYNLIGAIWTFDLDSDVLRLDKKDRNLWLPLNLLRQRPITIADFEPYEPPPEVTKYALRSVYAASCSRWRRKQIDVPRLQRHKAFVGKVLSDFAFQWRHVLCGRYNNCTFRRLAYAITRIITLDFTVKEVTQSRQGMGGFLVWIHDAPEWQFPHEPIVEVGGTFIVMCQHVLPAITLIGQHFVKQTHSKPGNAGRTLTYLILTVRELILCRRNSELEKYTEAEPLFDGTHIPSDEAIDLLLEATQSSPSIAPLRGLPVELQDGIVDKVSAGPIESAGVGCLLNAGSAFTWRCGDRTIEREEGRRSRTPWSPVESHIWFGSHSSGVAYK